MSFYKNNDIIFFDFKKYNNKENFYNDFFYLKYGVRIKNSNTVNDIIDYLN